MSEPDLFASYEESYCAAATRVSDGLAALASLPLERRRDQAKQLEKGVREAEQILQRLDMEARSMPPERARPALARVRDYKADLAKLRADAAAAGGGDAAARAELGLGPGGGGAAAGGDAGQRERLLSATDRLGRTSERIRAGQAQLLETEELGISVLSGLQRQRETILHSRDALGAVDVSVGAARDVLAVMGRRITQSKAMMWGIAAALSGAILLVLWAKITR